jgi:WD40 repeat protein
LLVNNSAKCNCFVKRNSRLSVKLTTVASREYVLHATLLRWNKRFKMRQKFHPASKNVGPILRFPRLRCFAVLAVIASVAHTLAAQERVWLVPQVGQKHVAAVAFSQDGRYLVTGGFDNTARLWNMETGVELRRFDGHQGGVTAVAFSPNGRFVLTASADKTARLWDAETGKELRQFGNKQEVLSVAFSPDGGYVLTGSFRGMQLWETDTGKEQRQIEVRDGVVSVAFSPEGRFVLTGSSFGAHLWDRNTWQELRCFGWHAAGEVDAVAFSPDGHYMLTGGDDKTAKLWETESCRELERFKAGDQILSVAFSPDGRYVLTGSWKNAWLWDTNPAKALRSFEGSDGVNAVFSPEGRYVVTATYDGAHIWDRKTWKELPPIGGHAVAVDSVAFSPDGRYLMTGARFTALWRADTGRELWRVETGGIASGGFSSDGHSLLTSSGSAAVLLDTDTGKEAREFVGAGGDVTSLALSPDGLDVVTTNWKGTVELWRKDTQKELRQFEPEPLKGQFLEQIKKELHGDISVVMRSRSVAFSPNGRYLLTGGGAARLWDAETGKELWRFEGSTDGRDPRQLSDGRQDIAMRWGVGWNRWVDSVAFSHDGRYLLTGIGRAIGLWDTETHSQLGRFEGQTVKTLAFSPDDHYVLTGGWDHTARLWDMATGKEVQYFEGHSDGINSVAFFPNGRFVLTGSDDGTTKLWETSTGRELATLVSFSDGGWAAVDPEGRFDTSDLDGVAPLVWVAETDPMRPLPLEIFMRDYYTPKLLARILNGKRLPAVRPIAEIQNRVQPKVEVIDSALESDGGHATVRIRVTSIRDDVQRGDRRLVQDSGAFDLRLFRDGKLVKQYPEIPYGAEKVTGAVTTEAELEAWRKQHLILETGETIITIPHVPLPQRKGVGQVVFTAYAFNRERIKSQTSVPFPAKIVPSLHPRHPRAYLITMGVNANQSGWDLTLAVPSAREAAALWTQKLQKDYDVVPVVLKSEINDAGVIVPNANATKEDVQEVLDILAGRKDNVSAKLRKLVDPGGKLRAATPDDAVVLYIASHGYADPEERFYVVPYDTGPTPGIAEGLLTRCRLQADQSSACATAEQFLDRAISSDELASWWQGVDAGEMVMVLDSCHSGAAPGKDFRPGPLGNRGFGQLSYDKRMRILAATQPDKTARATKVERLGHTLLIEALETTAANGGDQSIGEWLRATERQLRPRAKNLYPEIEESDLQFPELMDFVDASQAAPTKGSAQTTRTEPAEKHDSVSTDGETNQTAKPVLAEMVDSIWTDSETNLSWTETDNGKSVNWEEASQYCGDLRLGGFSDWRLPTIQELQTILSATRRSSQLDDDLVPGIKPSLNLDNVILWSDSKKETDAAWTLETSSYRRGYSRVQYSGARTNLRSSISMRALCTRGTAKSLIPPGLTKLALECDVECAASVDGSAPQHVDAYHAAEFPAIFGDHEIEASSIDGQNHISRKYHIERTGHLERASDAPVMLRLMPTWTDPETKLMWQTRDYGRQLSWREADDHCRQLRTDGYTDWRLPTIDELQTLLVRVVRKSQSGKSESVIQSGQVRAGLQLTNTCSHDCTSINEWSDSAYGPGMALMFEFNWVEAYPYGRAVSAGAALCVRDGKTSIQTTQKAKTHVWIPSGYPLLVECDLSCRVTVDGNPPRSVLAHRPTRFSVPEGVHSIEAKSADGRYRTTLTRATETQDSVFLALLPAWTDPDTGLIWTTKDNETQINWQQGKQYCQDLRLLDHVDWRLPTITELQTLAYPPLKGARDDSKTEKHFELNWDEMWSSTGVENGKAWSVVFGKRLDRRQRDARVADVVSDVASALCVRGTGNNVSTTGPALNIRCDVDCNVSLDGGATRHLKSNEHSRFPTMVGQHEIVATSAEDGSRVSFKHRLSAAEDPVYIAFLPTWTDSRTALMWTKKDNGEPFGIDGEKQAYCSELRIGGFRDWRLPTIQELRTIYWEHAFKESLQLSDCCELSNKKPSAPACYFDFDLGKPDCGGLSPTDQEPEGNVATRILCVRRATRE